MSPNFSLDELTASEYATRHNLDNSPDPSSRANLLRLAETLERVRSALGNVPVNVSSGYRSEPVNAAIGGSRRSMHRFGLAADFTARKFGPPVDVARAIIAAGIEFDQLIVEGGRWVHLGLSLSPARREVLTATFSPFGTQYTKGIA